MPGSCLEFKITHLFIDYKIQYKFIYNQGWEDFFQLPS